MLKNGIFCEMVILMVFKGFLVVKNLEILIQIGSDSPIYYYLHAKDLDEPKCQFLIKKSENAGIKNLNDPNAFIEYSNTMDDVYNNIDEYNPPPPKKKKNFNCA